jgi:hypothetical protein
MRKIIVVVVMVLATLFGATPANAYSNSDDETPGYMSAWEFQNATRGTMSANEQEWGVVGIGSIVVSQNGGKHIVKQYNYGSNWACTGSVAQVAYDQNKAGQYMSSNITLYIYEPPAMTKNPNCN